MLKTLDTLDAIDFLPEQYRKRRRQRHAYAWRLSALLLFGAFVLGIAVFQRRHQSQVESKLAEVETQHALAIAQNANVADAQAKLKAERTSADLFTYLRHPWPRTQIMAAIMEPLPDSITLSDWSISPEAVVRTASTNPASAGPPPDPKTLPMDKVSRRARDLQRLLQDGASQQYFVLLVGHANEAAALHEYLARLGTNPLFAKIDLRSIENVAPDARANRPTNTFKFTARAILRPGHGQTAAPPTASVASGPSVNAPLAQQRAQP